MDKNKVTSHSPTTNRVMCMEEFFLSVLLFYFSSCLCMWFSSPFGACVSLSPIDKGNENGWVELAKCRCSSKLFLPNDYRGSLGYKVIKSIWDTKPVKMGNSRSLMQTRRNPRKSKLKWWIDSMAHLLICHILDNGPSWDLPWLGLFLWVTYWLLGLKRVF